MKEDYNDFDTLAKELLKYEETTVEELIDDFINKDMVNKPPHYNIGEIQTLDYIKDVLVYNKKLDAYEGYLIGNIIKYLGTRLGNKGDKLEDMQKAKFYLDKLEEYNKEQ